MTFWQQLPFTIFMIAVLLIVFVLPFYLVFGGGMANFALGPLRRRFSGLTVHELPAPGDVSFVYHTYRGLLIWVTQDQHIVHAPPVDAEIGQCVSAGPSPPTSRRLRVTPPARSGSPPERKQAASTSSAIAR